MARQKAERYAAEFGIPDLSRSQWEYLIDERIFSEFERYVIKRYLLDDVTYVKLMDEIEVKFPDRPLQERQLKRIVKRCMNRLAIYV